MRGELEAAVATVERGAAERMEATERKVAACENEAQVIQQGLAGLGEAGVEAKAALEAVAARVDGCEDKSAVIIQGLGEFKENRRKETEERVAEAEAALAAQTTEGLAELRTELEGSLEAVRAEQTAASEEASRLADERVGAVAGDAKLAQEAARTQLEALMDSAGRADEAQTKQAEEIVALQGLVKEQELGLASAREEAADAKQKLAGLGEAGSEAKATLEAVVTRLDAAEAAAGGAEEAEAAAKAQAEELGAALRGELAAAKLEVQEGAQSELREAVEAAEGSARGQIEAACERWEEAAAAAEQKRAALEASLGAAQAELGRVQSEAAGEREAARRREEEQAAKQKEIVVKVRSLPMPCTAAHCF